MRYWAQVFFLFVLTLGVPVLSFATLLNFDTGLTSNVPIPNGYGGLNWSNVVALNADTFVPSGYQNGTVSHAFVALNEDANGVAATATISNPTPFDFNSVYLTGAWNDGMQILVQGFQGANPAYSQTVTVSYYTPTLFNFNYLGVNSVLLSVAAPGTVIQEGGTYFAMDNLTVNGSVPEPGTFALLVTGLAGVAALRRRKRA